VIIGDPETFAIESVITEAYEEPSLMALGYFIIHICGGSFGLKEIDATMLACSFDEVAKRIAGRGFYNPPFPVDSSAERIANAFIRAGYEPTHKDSERFFDIVEPEFRAATRRLEWAPDGDAAFDDGSYVLHLEDLTNVRLIGYLSTPAYVCDPQSLREIWLPIDDFYAILQNWHDRFETEWKASPKIPASRKVFEARD
jgi:hypothetical protein